PLESEHGILRDTLTRAPTQYPPRRASKDSHLLEDRVACRTPGGRFWSAAQSGRAPRYEGGCGSPLEHDLVARSRVVGSITRYLGDRIGNLREQRGQRPAVVDATLGNLDCDNLFRGLINPQVELAPCAPTTQAILSHAPFAGAVDPQSRRVND